MNDRAWARSLVRRRPRPKTGSRTRAILRHELEPVHVDQAPFPSLTAEQRRKIVALTGREPEESYRLLLQFGARRGF